MRKRKKGEKKKWLKNHGWTRKISKHSFGALGVLKKKTNAKREPLGVEKSIVGVQYGRKHAEHRRDVNSQKANGWEKP